MSEAIKVFLVDDEPIIRNGMKKLYNWEGNGFEIIGEAENGKEAFPLICSMKPDIILTDLKMPLCGGIELAKRVLEILPNTQIIIITGYDEFEYARQAIKIGVFDFLLKPVSPNELSDTLQRLKMKLKSDEIPDEEITDDTENLVEQIKLYINENYEKNITLKTLGNEFFFNASYISRAFKTKTGKNYSDYLLEVRIENAKRLLKTTSYSINYISNAVGIVNPKYFSKIFKETTGMQPIAYRKGTEEK